MYQLIYLFGEAFLLYLLTGWVVWLSGRRGGDALLLTTGATYLFLLTMSQVLAVRLLDISPFLVPGGVLSYSASVAVLDIASVKYGARLGRWL
ncbi:MAG: VUT family protein, partial [Thermocladium sp.]